MLSYEDVGKRFKDTQAVRGVSLSLRPGTVVGMVGHNGAGKSTLMRMAVGLVRPDTGSVTLDGTPLSRFGRLDGLAAASFDASTLPANWTPGTAVAIAAGLSRLPPGRAAEVLEQVGLAKVRNRRIAKLSMGMRQRLAIGLAILSRPRVLLLDEPTNALDPEIIRELHGWITEHAAAGNAVLVSSHNLPEVEQVADRIVVMHQGQIVRDSSTLDLLAGETVRIRVDRPDVFLEALMRAGRRDPRTSTRWICPVALRAAAYLEEQPGRADYRGHHRAPRRRRGRDRHRHASRCPRRGRRRVRASYGRPGTSFLLLPATTAVVFLVAAFGTTTAFGAGFWPAAAVFTQLGSVVIGAVVNATAGFLVGAALRSVPVAIVAMFLGPLLLQLTVRSDTASAWLSLDTVTTTLSSGTLGADHGLPIIAAALLWLVVPACVAWTRLRSSVG